MGESNLYLPPMRETTRACNPSFRCHWFKPSDGSLQRFTASVKSTTIPIIMYTFFVHVTPIMHHSHLSRHLRNRPSISRDHFKTSNPMSYVFVPISQHSHPLISPFNPPSTPPLPNLYPKLTATAQNSPKQSSVGPQRSWYVTALLSLILFTLHRYKPAL